MAGAVALAAAPFVYLAWRISAPNHFSGFIFLVDDGYAGLTRLVSGYRGEWLWYDHYTSERYGGVLLYAPVIWAGHLGGLLGVPPLLFFHLLRLAGVAALGFALLAVARWWAPQHWLGTAVLLQLGSGLGWLTGVAAALHLVNFVPFDLAAPESSAVYSGLHRPDYVLGSAVLIASFLAFRHPTWGRVLLAGAAMWLVVTVHPQMGVVLLAALSLEALWRWRAGADGRPQARQRVLMLAAWTACWAPFLPYAAWLQWHSPLVQAWSQAWARSVPTPLNYLLSLGLWLPLALWGAYHALRGKDERAYGLVSWAAVSLLALYLPMPALSLHRSLDAAHVPWMALGCAALWNAPWRPQLRFASGAVLCMTSFLLLAIPFTSQAVENSTIPASTWEALQYISAHHQGGDVVLSGRRFGLYAPVWAGVDAYDGQFAETLHVAEKDAAVAGFFRADSRYDSAFFLISNHIAWVYQGPDERAASQGRDWFAGYAGCKSGEPCPPGAPVLSRAWARGPDAVYELR